MALYESSDFDINSVGVPLTGMAAYAPVAAANVVSDTDLGSATLTLPAAYRRLGLYKDDGGAEDGRDDEDAIKFFQQGYKIPGAGTLTVKIGLAEDNPAVNALLDGKDPDANGVVYVDSSLPAGTFLLFVATRYKNGTELRRNGVARIKEVETDKEENGSVRAKTVTFEWAPDPLVNMAPFKKWFGIPGGVTLTVAPTTASVKVGQSTQLTATVTPSTLQVAWRSSDPQTARVDEHGTVTGVKAGGPVTVTASAGGKQATATVTVTEP